MKEGLRMKKTFLALLTAAVVAFAPVSAFALDYAVPEDAQSVTARFTVVESNYYGNEFSMVSEDGELTINITDNTLIYFPEHLPVCDESDEVSNMVRDLLFDRTLAEVLEGRNMRVIFEASDSIEPISIKVLFETITTGPAEIDPESVAAALAADIDEEAYGEDNGYLSIVTLPADLDEYLDITTLPGEIDLLDLMPIEVNGEIVVNEELLENAPAPFVENGVIMVPMRAVVEALGYDVTWNSELRSVSIGVGINVWIGNTEVHRGRMAPIEISAAPVIVDSLTFVPLDFFRDVIGVNAFWLEGQVVIFAGESDME